MEIEKFALERGYNPRDPKLNEDPARPGYPDPEFFSAHRAKLFSNLAERGYSPVVKFAMCFNDYPSFMSLHPNGRGTPRKDKFDAAAEMVARYLKNEIHYVDGLGEENRIELEGLADGTTITEVHLRLDQPTPAP